MSMMPIQHGRESPGHAWHGRHGVRITGFVTNDGEYHPYEGWVKLQGDTLALHGTLSENEYGERDHRLPAAQVTTLFHRTSTTRKVTGVMIVLTVWLGALGLVVFALAGIGTGS
jgi:hypothetical protein